MLTRAPWRPARLPPSRISSGYGVGLTTSARPFKSRYLSKPTRPVFATVQILETHPRTILRVLGFLRPRNHRSLALASARTPVDEKQSDPRRMVREWDPLFYQFSKLSLILQLFDSSTTVKTCSDSVALAVNQLLFSNSDS